MDLFQDNADAIVANAIERVHEWVREQGPHLISDFDRDLDASTPEAMNALKVATMSVLGERVASGVMIYAGTVRALGIALRARVPDSAQLISVKSHGTGEFTLAFAGDPPS